MATNLERLQNCSARQLEAFIRSIVSKRASEYVNWGAWLSSDDPDVVFLGEDALYRNADGTERECRFLKEERKEDGIPYRTVFFFEDNGDVTTDTVRADFVRKLSETAYPVYQEPTSVQKEEEAPAATPAEENDDFDFDSFTESMILSEINEAVDEAARAEDQISSRISAEEEEAAAQAAADKPFTDIQNIELDDEETPEEEPAPVSDPDSTDFLDYMPQLEEYDQAIENIENTLQMDLQDVPLDEEDEPIGELLQTLKERSALYDANDPEDHELPTIAFTAIAEDKLVNNE